mmetsp:Transcript_5205/g.14008  ORF Transcript_5205/g.14008 Transcript_5205/m.14008 type:complete len:300 (-) Transcript_5205:130-1029(-)
MPIIDDEHMAILFGRVARRMREGGVDRGKLSLLPSATFSADLHPAVLWNLHTQMRREDEVATIRMRLHAGSWRLTREANTAHGERDGQRTQQLVGFRELLAIFHVPNTQPLQTDGGPALAHDLVLPGAVGTEQLFVAFEFGIELLLNDSKVFFQILGPWEVFLWFVEDVPEWLGSQSINMFFGWIVSLSISLWRFHLTLCALGELPNSIDVLALLGIKAFDVLQAIFHILPELHLAFRQRMAGGGHPRASHGCRRHSSERLRHVQRRHHELSDHEHHARVARSRPHLSFVVCCLGCVVV